MAPHWPKLRILLKFADSLNFKQVGFPANMILYRLMPRPQESVFIFLTRIRLRSIRIRWKRSLKRKLFKNARQSGTTLKRCFPVYVYFSQTLTSHYRFQSTLPNINQDGHRCFTFLSLILISNLTACFQVN